MIGTTLILLADDAFDAYQKATGAVHDDSSGLLTINPTQYKRLQNLRFFVSDVIMHHSLAVLNHIHLSSFFIRLYSNSSLTLKYGLVP